MLGRKVASAERIAKRLAALEAQVGHLTVLCADLDVARRAVVSMHPPSPEWVLDRSGKFYVVTVGDSSVRSTVGVHDRSTRDREERNQSAISRWRDSQLSSLGFDYGKVRSCQSLKDKEFALKKTRAQLAAALK